MFQQRHMEAIAETLKRTKPIITKTETENEYVKRLYRWEIMVNQFSNMLQDSNPRYKPLIFKKASGMPADHYSG
jgi:hypothetical protein